MSRKEFNMLFFNLSNVNINKFTTYEKLLEDKKIYSDEEGYIDDYQATMTNEASYIYLVKKLKKEGRKLDAIYYTASKKTQEPIFESSNQESKKTKITHEEFFKYKVNQFFDDNTEYARADYNNFCPPYIIGNEISGKDLLDISAKIVQFILRKRSEVDADTDFNVFIDCNGGVREFMTVITSVIQTLPQNINVERIIGHYFDKDRERSIVVNKIDAYTINEFYSSIDDFIDYGRCDKLANYLSEHNLLAGNHDMIELLKTVKCLSSGYVLCRPKEMITYTIDLKKQIKAYKFKHRNDEDILYYLVYRIAYEYNKVFIHITNKEDYHTVIALIDYCLDHYLIQQALTLYSYELPTVLYGQGLIIDEKTQSKNLYETFYSDIDQKVETSKTIIYDYGIINKVREYCNNSNMKDLPEYLSNFVDVDTTIDYIKAALKVVKDALNYKD